MMQNQVPESTVEVLVANHFGGISTADLADWAIGALEQGFDSPGLRMLASFRPDEPLSDAWPYFARALRELGYAPPDEETLLRQYSRRLARHILEGALTAAEGVELMHSRVLTPLNHPSDLENWCFMWEGINPSEPGSLRELTEEEFDKVVRRQAELLLSRPAG